MPLINCKVELSLNWIENCVLTTAANANKATFKITDAKIYTLIVTLSVEDNVKLLKLLSEEFKRSIYWNKYKVIDNIVLQIAGNNEEKHIRGLPDSSYQGVKRLFVLAYYNTEGNSQVSIDSSEKYFLPRVEIENYNFYDQPVNDSIRQYDEFRKKSTGQGDDYTTGCLLDFVYFKKYYSIAANLSKQKALDADPKAIQQIIFTGKIKAAADNTRVIIYYILEQSKEIILQFSKGTISFVINING